MEAASHPFGGGVEDDESEEQKRPNTGANDVRRNAAEAGAAEEERLKARRNIGCHSDDEPTRWEAPRPTSTQPLRLLPPLANLLEPTGALSPRWQRPWRAALQ